MSTVGEYIDLVKFGWGTTLVTPDIERKFEVLRSAGIGYYFGGTLFEKFVQQDRFESFLTLCRLCDCRYVEVSNGTVSMPNDEKAGYIRRCAEEFTVLSEVGSKDSSIEYTAAEWKQWLREELEAGAWKVVTEAREGGTAGIFDSSGGMRTELIGEIALEIGPVNVIFEAPSKAAQAWFIKQFGPSVNLGNIPPEEVIPLETLRLGLRGDTLKEVLLRGQPAPS